MRNWIFGALALASAWIAIRVDVLVPNPYMDEVFHIPQAQMMCANNATSNPQITTPPGLYWSVCAVSKIFGINPNVTFLRGFNTFIGLFLLLPLMTNSLWNSLNAYLHPVSFFFFFFFYTDTLSSTLVFAMIFSALKNHYKLSASIGAFACLVRQTNVAWIIYVALSTALRFPKTEYFRILTPFFSSLFFLGILALKNGIVLGDKQNHPFSLHIPQIYYLMSQIFFFHWPVLFSFREISALVIFLIKKIRTLKDTLLLLLVICLVVLSIHFFTYHHIFVLSDNRHFVFYIWRWFFRSASLNKFLYIPLYLCSMWIVLRKLAKTHSVAHCIVFFACSALCLVPSSLLEFRYFIIPTLIFRSSIYVEKRLHLALETLWLICLNAAVFYIFHHFDIKWNNVPQRIMW